VHETARTPQSNPTKASKSKQAAQHKASPPPRKQSAPRGEHSKGR
jgi:hypothetical protein